MNVKRILLCEDDQILRKSLVLALELEGHIVSDFGNAEEALQLDSRILESFELLLTDLEMPGLNGLQLAAELTQLQPEIVVYLMSGHQLVWDNVQVLPTRFFRKPFALTELLHAVKNEPIPIRKNTLPPPHELSHPAA